jgi:hypothetical protein
MFNTAECNNQLVCVCNGYVVAATDLDVHAAGNRRIDDNLLALSSSLHTSSAPSSKDTMRMLKYCSSLCHLGLCSAVRALHVQPKPVVHSAHSFDTKSSYVVVCRTCSHPSTDVRQQQHRQQCIGPAAACRCSEGASLALRFKHYLEPQVHSKVSCLTSSSGPNYVVEKPPCTLQSWSH